MGWFTRKPPEQKYVKAAIRVATNLYLHTIPGAEDAPAPLEFNLGDSRFRYMIFCLSAAVSAALAYDEQKQIQPEALIKGCLNFATWTVQKILGNTSVVQRVLKIPSTARPRIFKGPQILVAMARA